MVSTDPLFEQLLEVVLKKLVKPTDEPRDNQTLLADYVEHQYRAYLKQLTDAAEAWEDKQDAGTNYVQPNPPEDLIMVIALQSVIREQTYHEIAYRAYHLSRENESLKGLCRTYRYRYEQALKAAKVNRKAVQMYEHGVNPDNRSN